ncbi:sensor histidine kinase [Pseudoalteromonas tunicata]|uniref:histidine kinase n=1 Tax=Pseudoalteromonas tunicata D2 TaxID=87626 RepID=A4CFB8_9GAMM|nr:HAMP domain-containing sensor histidine kinase [Pseudoalteromonas tunicata]ATC92947.1 hypothetical protein PTUN_a0106 [Pseudoalteromonas tunicata]AXT32046.1 sensor histidine kinase [Pseudoalteromonas tunicata]EAR26556.1 Sensor protein atoS [Pseudoalteromonas tunicata D2]
MSIKRYFILGISVIFLLLATSQALLVLYFKDQVRQDISKQSQVITKKLINKARDSLNERIFEFKGSAPKMVMITDEITLSNTSTPPPPKPVSAPEPIAPPMEPTTEIQKFEFEINTNSNTSNGPLKEHQLFEIRQEELSDELNTIFIKLENDDNIQHVINGEFRSLTTSNSFEKFAELILWSIVISSLVAIVFMAYFAHMLTRPIAALNAGFVALRNGELGCQVTPQGVAEIASCITQFNHTSQRLAQLSESEKQLEQQRQLVELGELSRAVAHSLRNPIHTLGLTLEQYWQSESAQQQQHLQHIAHNKIAHLNKNITALLTLSNNDVRRDQLVPITAVIQDILLELGSEQARFVLELDHTLNIFGLESEIRTILHTIIVNAVEANHLVSNTIKPVKISSHQQAEQLIITVQDNGPGFSDAILAHLFEPHISSKADGAGMGLYLANRIAHLYYQGSITVTNQQDGATVTIILTTGTHHEHSNPHFIG